MRNIYIVTATQVVTSDTHPEGVYSVLNGYPIRRDSRDYERTEANPNGSDELALIVAQARWDGVTIQRKSFGGFPDMTPVPEPEPEPEPQQPEE